MPDAKINMIKQQLHTAGVIDEKILHLFERIDRKFFVGKSQQNLAYADMSLPMVQGEQMLAPSVQAKILQALAIQPNETVLEIGTGNGFFTALLAALAKHVISVEFHKSLSEKAAKNLQNQGVLNVDLIVGNGANGVKVAEPVDVIVLTGGLPFLPEGFKNALSEQGRVLAILGDSTVMQVTLLKRNGAKFTITPLFETSTTMLRRAPETERFVF